MRSIVFILLLLLLAKPVLSIQQSSENQTNAESPEEEFICEYRFDKICCKPECPYCGWCNEKGNFEPGDLNGTYRNFYYDCCAEIILESNLTCNLTMGPPCILDSSYFNDWDRIVDFFNNGETYLIVIVSIALFVLAGFLLYTCCIFGKRDPPLEYKYIVHSLRKLD